MNMIKTIKQYFSNDIGIDLGTKNSVVYLRGEGIILREPSVVAIDKHTQAVVAIGDEAFRMVGRTPGNIIAVRPLKEGVIADYDMTEHMVKRFVTKSRRSKKVTKPTVIIGVPWGITAVEKRAVIDSAKRAGAKKICIVAEPYAAAIGVGLDITKPTGHMVVDIGGGTTEVAVLSLSGIVICKSIRMAGDQFDESIISHCRKNYNLLIGERMAEQVKIKIGSACPFPAEKDMMVKGRDLISGLPNTFTISSYEIRDALSECVSVIVNLIGQTLEKTPPELSSDIMRKGIFLAGGGSLIYGLDTLIKQKTDIDVYYAKDPLSCVANGTGKILEDNMPIDTILSSDHYQ